MSEVTILWCVIWGSCAIAALGRGVQVMLIPAVGMLIWWVFR